MEKNLLPLPRIKPIPFSPEAVVILTELSQPYPNAVTMVITVTKFWSYRLFNQQYNSKFIWIMPIYKLYSRMMNKTLNSVNTGNN